jgi:spore maturation protein CgeB
MGKILFFEWNAFMQDCVERSMTRLGLSFDRFFYLLDKEDWDACEPFQKAFTEKLDSGSYDTVFSMDFCPVVSDVCEERHIHYISWIYDSPIHIRRTETLKNACNDVYFFDRVEYETRLKSGVVNGHHLPLAVEPEKYTDVGIAQTIRARKAGIMHGITSDPNPDSWYDCDVALVGSLYKSRYAYICGPLGDYDRGYLEGIVKAQQNISGGYILDDMCSDTLVEKLNETYTKVSTDGVGINQRQLVYALGTEVTNRDRYTILALLANRCKVNLYSGDTDKRLDKVNFKGYVDYDIQMPKAFRRCKINLNISLRVIQSGIPLRVLDILGCGGFLITNYQPEIAEHFVSGRDLVIYEDYADLVQKAEYYLAHDDERRAIAHNGYERVKELFNFDDRVRTMFGEKARF